MAKGPLNISKTDFRRRLMEKLMESDEFANIKQDDDGVLQLKPKHAQAILDTMKEIVEKALSRNGRVTIGDIVTIKLNARNARMGRNPATGDSIWILAKSVVKALPHASLKKEFNVAAKATAKDKKMMKKAKKLSKKNKNKGSSDE